MIRAATKGFSLIEVLFTLIVISIAAVAISRSGLNNLNLISRTKSMNEATLLAQNLLKESLSMPSDKIVRTGLHATEKVKYQWSTVLGNELVTDANSEYSINMEIISVTVNWLNKSRQETITLSQYLCQQPETKAQH
ncbi:MAG: type II secretion system protein [Sedimentisphaerales bacterium]|nr:type II secretion system protein [Sedimentisphaerales bacterium]